LPQRVGIVYFEDPETQDILPFDLSDSEVKGRYIKMVEQDIFNRKKYLQSIKADVVELSTDGEYIKPLSLFFRKRERRMQYS